MERVFPSILRESETERKQALLTYFRGPQADRTVHLMTESTALKANHVQVVVLRLVSKVIGGQL